ncbi:pickpocket protein 11-like [Daktulosphaira vitifoliae]|uniref:pickpocket protein 11-like n=1 Tax=Daktulosphaira vitifoliae TaxID=58002 RepID=UPI0021A9F374|nr:pickpocket protein 11-like [Daktulosphaira vitifoliae]
MYWNELNPQKKIIPFKFDDSSIKRTKTRAVIKLKTTINKFINLFFSSSNIHGFNHLTHENRHFIEKLLWVIVICFCIYGAKQIGESTWTRYQENPTVISMERDYKEWSTALPAITLCPTDNLDNQKFEEIIEKEYPGISEDEKSELREFLVLLANATYGTFKKLPFYDKIKPYKYLSLVENLQIHIMYTITNSNMEGYALFNLVSTISELGFCHTYNGEIAPYNDYYYWMQNNRTILPTKGFLSGTPLDGDVFTQITSMNFGYIGFLHSPYEAPDIANRIYSSPESYYKTLDVSALSIYSTSDIISLKPKQRGCRYTYESELKTSPIYTYNLCRNECRMEQAKRLCGCVPFFYRPDPSFKICDVKGMHCLDEYEDYLVKLRNTSDDNKKVFCGCLPPCDDVSYIVEGENTIQWFLGTNLKWGLIKFPKMRLKRNLLFGFTDVLVSIGGAAGLFFGCSVLSFLEIIYFLTLQLFCIAFTKRENI